MVYSHQFIILKILKKYILREWELKQCLKTIKLVVTILVSAKANETRLNNLILLIAISYTISSFIYSVFLIIILDIYSTVSAFP